MWREYILAQRNKKTKSGQGCSPDRKLQNVGDDLMDKVAAASINSFGPMPKADAPPSEPIFVLTASQLQDIISQAVEKAIDELSELKAAIAFQDEKIRSLEAMQEAEISRICVDIAYDRQRLAKLEKSEPGPTDEERMEKLEGYLKDKKSAGMKPEASFTEARTHLEVSRSQFSKLISKLDLRDFVVFPHPLNYKSKMIGLAHKM